MNDRRDHWQKAYQGKPPERQSWHQATPAISLALIEAGGSETGLGAESRIVDVGGGTSLLIDHLLDRGYRRISVLDIAPAPLELAQARLGDRAGGIEWFTADVTAWTPPHRFDIWHDRAVFHFLTDATDRAAYVATLGRALAPEGQVVIATFSLDGPEKCSGLPVMRHGPDTLSAELGPGFTLLETRYEDHVTPAGGHQRFVYCRFGRT